MPITQLCCQAWVDAWPTLASAKRQTMAQDIPYTATQRSGRPSNATVCKQCPTHTSVVKEGWWHALLTARAENPGRLSQVVNPPSFVQERYTHAPHVIRGTANPPRWVNQLELLPLLPPDNLHRRPHGRKRRYGLLLGLCIPFHDAFTSSELTFSRWG